MSLSVGGCWKLIFSFQLSSFKNYSNLRDVFHRNTLFAAAAAAACLFLIGNTCFAPLRCGTVDTCKMYNGIVKWKVIFQADGTRNVRVINLHGPELGQYFKIPVPRFHIHQLRFICEYIVLPEWSRTEIFVIGGRMRVRSRRRVRIVGVFLVDGTWRKPFLYNNIPEGKL